MFWPTLHAVGLTPRLLQPEEYREILTFGLGLTDLVKAVAGVDTQLSEDHFDRDRLHAMIQEYQPKILTFTSKQARRSRVLQIVPYWSPNRIKLS